MCLGMSEKDDVLMKLYIWYCNTFMKLQNRPEVVNSSSLPSQSSMVIEKHNSYSHAVMDESANPKGYFAFRAPLHLAFLHFPP
jgi:hypothetical protein